MMNGISAEALIHKAGNEIGSEESFPYVSIIIPAKNEEKILPLCLDSILAIDYPRNRYEVILVDNGSTDRTVALAQERGVQAYSCPELTIGAMRNYGVSASKGSIVAFIDADVIVAKEWLDSAIHCLRRHSDAVCLGSFPLVPEEFGWVARAWWQLQRPIHDGEEFKVGWLPSMNMIVKREAFWEAGGFNPQLVTSEDVDLCYRISEKRSILYCASIKAYHYGEARTLTHLFQKERWRGRSNYDGIFSHGLKVAELPSLLMPIYFMILCLAIIWAAFSVNGYLLGILAIMLMAPSFIKCCLSTKKGNYRFMPQMVVCYTVYSFARMVSAIDWFKGRIIAV
ncbi:MAG: glycosyltransferase [Acidobacteria bacterium]|nr:glycosyltransferase [Acidobacteriota bacterium]